MAKTKEKERTIAEMVEESKIEFSDLLKEHKKQ